MLWLAFSGCSTFVRLGFAETSGSLKGREHCADFSSAIGDACDILRGVWRIYFCTSWRAAHPVTRLSLFGDIYRLPSKLHLHASQALIPTHAHEAKGSRCDSPPDRSRFPSIDFKWPCCRRTPSFFLITSKQPTLAVDALHRTRLLL